MELREYQKRTIALLTDEPTVVCMPTGAGKTVLAQHLLANGGLMTCHLRTLVHQTARRLGGGILMGSHKPGDNPIIVASIATLQRRTLPEIPILIIDECHRAASDGYRKVIDEYLRRGTRVVGLTATPKRADGKGLRDVGFTQLVNPVSYEELFAEGVLVRPRCYEPHRPDMKGVHTVAGDYDSHEAAAKVLAGKVGEHWKMHGDQRRGMVFSCNVEHSQELVAALRAVGARAVHLDANSPETEREDRLGELRDSKLDVVSNCMLFGEGLDVPELDLMFLCRPTKSIALYRQQAGRIMRPAPGKADALLLDHAGNIKRHGYPWSPVMWSLDGDEKFERVELRTCKECFAVIPARSKCPCGVDDRATHETVALQDITHTNEVLVESKAKAPEYVASADPMYWDCINRARILVPYDSRVSAYASMVLKGIRNGYKRGWAFHAWTKMFRMTKLPTTYSDVEEQIRMMVEVRMEMDRRARPRSLPELSSASPNSEPGPGGNKPVGSASSTHETASEPSEPESG